MDAFLVILALCMVISFALCGVPFGLIISKRVGGVDVREHGSGNIGMTNVARTVGAEAAALTFACDVGKGVVSMLLARFLLGRVLPDGATLEVTSPYFAALTIVYACCVAGHVFSPYLGFHGGKGISVGFGAALGLHWPAALVLLGVFLLLAVPTRYISLGSIMAAFSLPIQCFFLWHMSPWALVPIIVVSLAVIWAHRSNIVKLLHGDERRFTISPDASLRSRRRKVPPTARRNDEE